MEPKGDPLARMMVANRNVRVASTTGHVIRFEKGVSRLVPYTVQAECEHRGVIYKDETDRPAALDMEVFDEIPQGPARLVKVQRAMIRLAQRNEEGDFTGAGMPDAKKLSMVLGFQVSARERNQLWDPIAQQLAVGTPVESMTSFPVRSPAQEFEEPE